MAKEKQNAELTEETRENAEAKAQAIIEKAKEEAAAIVAAAREEAEPSLAAPKRREDNLVPIRLFKDGDKYKDDVFVAVNGRSWQIRRGETVMVPDYVAEVLEQSMAQDTATANLIERESSAYAAEAKARNLEVHTNRETGHELRHGVARDGGTRPPALPRRFPGRRNG